MLFIVRYRLAHSMQKTYIRLAVINNNTIITFIKLNLEVLVVRWVEFQELVVNLLNQLSVQSIFLSFIWFTLPQRCH